MKPGNTNLITDVTGLRVGNADDAGLRSGATAVICDAPAIAAVHVMGGAPGTRETDLLAPENTVETVNAIVLSGGSAFGLDAASGVQAALRAQGVGFALGGQTIPIVPAAILFDLANGGNKDWGLHSPYRDLGLAAARSAAKRFDLGSAGAGAGALTATVKGGLGSASALLPCGVTIGALVAVNSIGSTLIGDGPHFWAAPFEEEAEFAGLGLPHPFPVNARQLRVKKPNRPETGQQPGMNTTIAVIATDAVLTKAQAKRLATVAHDGFARAIWPAHTPLDGDLVFALSTGTSNIVPALGDWLELGAAAAATMARAIARGVHGATDAPGDMLPSWQKAFAGARR